MAAYSALSASGARVASPRPALPKDLPLLRPLGFAQPAKFASSVDRVQATSASAGVSHFVRPDVPPAGEFAARPWSSSSHKAHPRANGRSALEQAAFVTNAKLVDVRSKGSALPAFKLGVFGF